MRPGHRQRPPSWSAWLLLVASTGSMAEGEVYVLPSGHAVDARGNVVADDLRLTPDDKVTGENGRVYDPDQLHLGPQGELLTPDGSPVKKGFRIRPRRVAGQAAVIAPAGRAGAHGAEAGTRRKGPGVKMVVGGQSEEGVAKTTTLPIIK